MKIREVTVRNFRAIKDATVKIDDQTAVIGANGTGKSCLLRAIDRFYGSSTSVELDDFFGRDASTPIEIAITFSDFTAADREAFGERINGEELRVLRVFTVDGGRNNGRYYGYKMQHANFLPIRNADGARPQQAAYREIAAQAPYTSLPTITRADQIPDALDTWEKAHLGQCELARDDGQFLGFTNVAKGSLSRATTFVFIPAVRDANQDAIDGKGSPVARLMELVVRSAVAQRKDIQDWQQKIAAEYKKLTDPEKLTELSGLADELSATLRMFYEDAGVDLQWREASDFSVPLPNADVFLDEEGFRGPVDKKGHGLQRALVLTLLQHLAKATATAEQVAVEAKPDEPINDLGIPNIVLAIEEPELYQHPTKQRHFANVLSRLSRGEIAGVAARTQVLYATHSTHFVSMERFNEIRLAARSVDVGGVKQCEFNAAELSEIAAELQRIWPSAPGTYSANTVRARLHVVGQELCDALFANCAVLVEGPGDRAALVSVARSMGIDFEAKGIAVVDAGGKTVLDKPIAIFRKLKIPTFALWDCDDDKEHPDTNKALQRLMGVPEEQLFSAATRIEREYACFESKLEKTLEGELGAKELEEAINDVRAKYSIQKKDQVLKSSFAMTEVVNALLQRGKRSATLCAIVEAIVTLRS